jgi:hypothetical protein
MTLAVLAKSARNALSVVEINFNRFAGREFIPAAPDMLFMKLQALQPEMLLCAYVKKQSPKVSMNDEFSDCVRQGTAMEYRLYELTPCTGDIFMDRHIFNKFKILQNHPGVESYQFFTNMTIPKVKDIERIFNFAKLKMMTVSIYGHDLESFIAITKSTRKVYERLIRNLETLLALLKNRKLPLRSSSARPKTQRGAGRDLLDLFERFKSAASIRARPTSTTTGAAT